MQGATWHDWQVPTSRELFVTCVSICLASSSMPGPVRGGLPLIQCPTIGIWQGHLARSLVKDVESGVRSRRPRRRRRRRRGAKQKDDTERRRHDKSKSKAKEGRQAKMSTTHSYPFQTTPTPSIPHPPLPRGRYHLLQSEVSGQRWDRYIKYTSPSLETLGSGIPPPPGQGEGGGGGPWRGRGKAFCRRLAELTSSLE